MFDRIVSFLKWSNRTIQRSFRSPKLWQAPGGLFTNREDVPAVFETIYRKAIWGGGSGGGSNPEGTRRYVEYLQAFLKQHSIKSVVDLGCGDWQFSRFIDWSGIKYLGVDVVESVIHDNQCEFQANDITFTTANVLEDPDSIGGADLLILKDVLQHLSNENVLRILKFCDKFKFVLITNDFSDFNQDCNNGDTRPIDPRKAPFNLTSAKLVLCYHGKGVFLWQSLDSSISA